MRFGATASLNVPNCPDAASRAACGHPSKTSSRGENKERTCASSSSSGRIVITPERAPHRKQARQPYVGFYLPALDSAAHRRYQRSKLKAFCFCLRESSDHLRAGLPFVPRRDSSSLTVLYLQLIYHPAVFGEALKVITGTFSLIVSIMRRYQTPGLFLRHEIPP